MARALHFPVNGSRHGAWGGSRQARGWASWSLDLMTGLRHVQVPDRTFQLFSSSEICVVVETSIKKQDGL